MSQGGPRPSAFYVERQLLARLPNPPSQPSSLAATGVFASLSSNYAAGQNDPGPGNPQPGDGLVLANLMAIVVSVYLQAGQTFSGAGSLQCYLFNPYQALWTRCPDLDLDMSIATGAQNLTFATLRNPSRLGMLINFLPVGVTASTGTADMLLRIDGFNSVLGMSS